jgi:glycerol-3-phosphate acyltransferase PlsX
MKVALDAMGGDSAPEEVVAGALLSRSKAGGPEIILVGDEPRVRDCVARLGGSPDTFGFVHAPEVIGMHESPVEAIRKKRGSSIVGSVKLVRDGQAGAVVSAGHTGAAVAASTLLLKTIPGIKKPGIAVTLPTAGERGCTVLDVGANIHAKPDHLFQYGLMASQYVRAVLGVQRPSIGLLNIGEEDAKGTDLVKKTHALFSGSDLNFTGNVEGRDIFRGHVDIVVCEGFVGNVVLKAAEGMAEAFVSLLGRASKKHAGDVPGGDKVIRGILGDLDTMMNYSEVGGALLLGVEGVCLIAHGRSDARAIANALRLAGRFIDAGVTRQIADGIRLAGETVA